MSAWGFWLIAAFLWAVTAYAGWLSYQRATLVDSADRFVEVIGKVEASAVKERGGTGQFSAAVLVAYEVGGKGYSLETNGLDGKVARGEGSGSAAADANALIGRFPAGDLVTVFYDPEDPEVSSLTRKVEGGRGLGTAITTFLLSLGYSIWLLRRRKRA
jgi:hypothetical protein